MRKLIAAVLVVVFAMSALAPAALANRGHGPNTDYEVTDLAGVRWGLGACGEDIRITEGTREMWTTTRARNQTDVIRVRFTGVGVDSGLVYTGRADGHIVFVNGNRVFEAGSYRFLSEQRRPQLGMTGGLLFIARPNGDVLVNEEWNRCYP